MKPILLALLLTICLRAAAQEKLSFPSFNEVLSYADGHSSTFKNATEQVILAKYQTLAAVFAQWNIKADAALSSVDNTKLPVSFIPADVFGGPAGTLRELTLGIKYVSNASVSPQIDILNVYATAKIKMYKANEQLTKATNLLNKKDLYESLAGAYYNILSFQWQIAITKNVLANADTLLRIVQNKQKQGIARDQDVSNAITTQLNTRDKLQQLEIQLEQQYSSLKLLCDIPLSTPVIIGEDNRQPFSYDAGFLANSILLQQQSQWLMRYQEKLLSSDKKIFLPVLTGYSNFTLQQNSNTGFYDNSKWINISYVGLKLTLPLVPDAAKIAAVKYDQINLRVSQINYQHAVLQDSVNNQQAQLDYQKAFNTYQIASQIASLKYDVYQKNVNIYKEGILSSTDLFLSFNDWLNSSLNEEAQLATGEYYKSRIMIRNSVK